VDDSVIAEHVVVTTRHRRRDLLEFQIAAWLWSHIAAALPQAFSLVLMPDHLHLMAPPGCVPRLRAVLTGATQRFGIRFDIAVFDHATTPQILGRMIRYGFYNPVRAGLVDDPWRWPWSSLRDLAACVFPVWTELGHVAQALRLSPSRALRGLTCLGESRPAAPAVALPEVVSPPDAAAAVASVLRLPTREVWGQRLGRRLVV